MTTAPDRSHELASHAHPVRQGVAGLTTVVAAILLAVAGILAALQGIAAIASDRKAADVRVIDLRGIVSYTDFFVICSGNTERQTKAIHDSIHEELKEEGLLVACHWLPAFPGRSSATALVHQHLGQGLQEAFCYRDADFVLQGWMRRPLSLAREEALR